MVIIPVILHRARWLSSDVFVIVEAVTAGIVVLGLLLALIALIRLWRGGDHGWGRAISALALSLLCMIPFAWVGAQSARYPAVTDMATTSRDLLPLVFEPGTARMPTPKMLDDASLEAEFPNVKTRTYPLSAVQAFQIVRHLVEARGWDIRQQSAPAVGHDVGLINAQATSLLGWRDEAVLRVEGHAAGSSVDMRSASLNSRHDLGTNGARIEQFLTELDDQITSLLRDNPNLNQPIEAEPDAPVTP